MTAAAAVQASPQPASLIARVATRFGVEPNKMLATLKATAFRSDKEVSNEAMMALLVVADQYNLNPWTKELYAFPDKRGGIVPVVGVDGWSRIINEHPQYDGCEFKDGPVDKNGVPEWIECTLFRKDRAHPTTVREYFAECKRATDPWASHPRRMLRHKAFMQAGRIGFAFVGIYDEDEAQRIIEGEALRVPEDSAAIASINQAVSGKPPLESEAVSEQSGAPSANGGPTFADIAAQINKAEIGSEFDLCRDLIRGHKDRAQAEELDALLVARGRDFGATAAKAAR